MSRRESVQNMAGISDWPTQLAVVSHNPISIFSFLKYLHSQICRLCFKLKVMFNTDDLNVKYLDDEDEEVKIESQNDYEFANQVIKFFN